MRERNRLVGYGPDAPAHRLPTNVHVLCSANHQRELDSVP